MAEKGKSLLITGGEKNGEIKFWRRKWQPTPVFLLGNLVDGGAWWATVHGVTKSWTQLSTHAAWTPIIPSAEMSLEVSQIKAELLTAEREKALVESSISLIKFLSS